VVPFSGGYAVAAASADTQYTDLLRVHGVEALKIIDRGVDITYTFVWIFKKMRFSPAGTLEGRIIDDCRESGFGKSLRVCPCSLFFDTAARWTVTRPGVLLDALTGLKRRPARLKEPFLMETSDIVQINKAEPG
jgi:hypothetical protein